MNVRVVSVTETAAGHEVRLSVGDVSPLEESVFVPCGKRRDGGGRRGKPAGWEPKAGSNAARVLAGFEALGAHGAVATEVKKDAALAWLRQREAEDLQRWGHMPRGKDRAEPWDRAFFQFAVSDLTGGGKLRMARDGVYVPVLKAEAPAGQVPLF